MKKNTGFTKQLFRYTAFFFALILIPRIGQTANHHTSGRILINVEQYGEAWYVDPITGARSFLGRPAEALRILHEHALGVKNDQLQEIPKADENRNGNIDLRRKLRGRVLLQVESRGEAWYVHPDNLKRYPLQSDEDALFLMRRFSLGITNANLNLIPVKRARSSAYISQELMFTAQAPFGDWDDPRQADGCEESSALMAISWARNKSFSLEQARSEILTVSNWEKERYGYFQDTSIQDTADRIFREYYDFHNIEVRNNIHVNDILRELQNGHVVLTSINGQKIGNAYYRGAGPLRHMLVVVGYDDETQEFITHDPGTRFGAYLRFHRDRLQSALQDYASGEQVPVGPPRTAMIIVRKS